jgi:hypothetical protein
MKTAVEMTGHGHGWKTKGWFPNALTALGNRPTTRFPDSHSRDEERESGKRKARFPTFPLTVLCLFLRLRKEARQRIAPLQAHSWMRKCFQQTSVRAREAAYLDNYLRGQSRSAETKSPPANPS